MYLTNKSLKVQQINSIEMLTDAFINNANVMIDIHHLLAGYPLSYLSIIRGAVVDAPFNRVDQYDQQLRPYNQTRTMSQIDGH
jgi:hypothetical protein